MSLVTTARSYSAPRVRHSAAANAVLPEPTGPPRPTRNWPPCRWPCSYGSTQSSRLWSGGKEPVLPCGVDLGEEVEEGIGDGGQRAVSARGDGVDVGGEPGGDGGDGERVHGQQPLGGGRRAADRQIGGGLCGG